MNVGGQQMIVHQVPAQQQQPQQQQQQQQQAQVVSVRTANGQVVQVQCEGMAFSRTRLEIFLQVPLVLILPVQFFQRAL